MHIVGCVFLCPRNARVASACGSWRATNVARALRNRLLGPREILLRGRSSSRAKTHQPRARRIRNFFRAAEGKQHPWILCCRDGGHQTDACSMRSDSSCHRLSNPFPFLDGSRYSTKDILRDIELANDGFARSLTRKRTPDSDLRVCGCNKLLHADTARGRSDLVLASSFAYGMTTLPANCLSLVTPGRGRKPLGPGVVIIRRYSCSRERNRMPTAATPEKSALLG